MNELSIASRKDIPIGRENAISRAELCRKWRCGDRLMRKYIADFRAEINDGDEKYAILSSSTAPSGYWRSDDPRELQEYIRETESRARSNFVALRGARMVLNRVNSRGQVSIDAMMRG